MIFPKGITARRTKSGIMVAKVHYSADPERDSSWAATERPKYSSQAAWDQEQEIVHYAGGGELLFAEILNRHADKIIIRDPSFQIPPQWDLIAGFDHGKVNPTAALVVAVDYDGVIYCKGEYYQPGLTPSQHMEHLRNLPGFLQSRIYADPSIFYRTETQSEGSLKSIADLYAETGLANMFPGENPEIAGMERILEHWRDLDHRQPTLKIICQGDYSRKRFGLFPDGCPNLLWELMRTRREQSSASQLLRKNPTEAIVGKDNHLRDGLKYVLMSLPSPSEKPAHLLQEEMITRAIANGDHWAVGTMMARFKAEQRAKSEPVYYRPRMPRGDL